MTPADLLGRLSDRFRLLTGGRRTAVARHRTLRAVVDWSWDLLAADEKVLLQRLSVFHAPVAVDAAAAVAADLGDELTVADLLGSLVEKSLLQLRPGPSRGTRCWRRSGSTAPTPGRLGAGRGRPGGPDAVGRGRRGRCGVGSARSRPAAWSQRLDAEADDLLAALRHLAAAGRAERALRTTVPVALWWSALGRHAEVREWTTVARSAGPTGTPWTSSARRWRSSTGSWRGRGSGRPGACACRRCTARWTTAPAAAPTRSRCCWPCSSTASASRPRASGSTSPGTRGCSRSSPNRRRPVAHGPRAPHVRRRGGERRRRLRDGAPRGAVGRRLRRRGGELGPRRGAAPARPARGRHGRPGPRRTAVPPGR